MELRHPPKTMLGDAAAKGVKPKEERLSCPKLSGKGSFSGELATSSPTTAREHGVFSCFSRLLKTLVCRFRVSHPSPNPFQNVQAFRRRRAAGIGNSGVKLSNLPDVIGQPRDLLFQDVGEFQGGLFRASLPATLVGPSFQRVEGAKPTSFGRIRWAASVTNRLSNTANGRGRTA